MSNKKKSFLLHIDSLDILDDLTNGQAGVLFKAIKAYQKDEEFDLDSIVKIAFSPFKNQFARDNEKYEKLCEKNRLIAINRHKNKSTSGTSGNDTKPTVTKSTDNKNKKDSDNDSDSNIKDLSVITDGFEHWWNLYPTARRKNKKGCLVKFKSKCKGMNEDQIIDLINLISNDIDKRVKEIEDIKYLPMTEPYLNQERWNDGQ